MEQAAEEGTHLQGDPQQKEDEIHQEKPHQHKKVEEMTGVTESVLTYSICQNI